MEYKVASLFAGIGGLCIPFLNHNCKIAWAIEIDKNASKTYRLNFGDTYLVEDDIKNIDEKNIPDIDILNAGFPCQSFSIAGYQKGFNDERGNLFFEIIRILKEKKPKAILLENVKNLLNHDNGQTFQVIKQQLENIGYYVKYKVLNTYQYGNTPQNRERIYIVGFTNKDAFDKFDFPDEIPLTKNVTDIINSAEKQDEKYYYTQKYKIYQNLVESVSDKNSIYQWRRIYCRKNKKNLCPTLTANMGTGGHNVPIIKDDYGIRKLTPVECILFQGFPNSFKFPSDITDSAKYKQAGNSVSVPVVERIVKNLIKSLEN